MWFKNRHLKIPLDKSEKRCKISLRRSAGKTPS
jgi:hypothetical protein